MKVITTIFMTFLLVASIWAGAAHSEKPPLAEVVFYVS
jgi:hypothetical protein